MFLLSLSLFAMYLPLCHHPLFLIPQQLSPTSSLLKSICQIVPSFLDSLSHFSAFPSHLPCPFCQVLFFHSFPFCKSHVYSSLSYLSLFALFFLCVLDSEPAETKGHGGLTLIDVSEREKEEGRERRLWPDKVNSVFPGGN